MFKNYLLTAFRHIMKNRLFSAINVFGLAIGMMSCILILLYVKDELTYDRWIPESEKIVRLHSNYAGNPPFLTVSSAGRMKDAVLGYARNQVEEGVRLVRDGGFNVIQDGSATRETAFYADASFFKVFDLPFVHGSVDTSFVNPLDVVLSEEMAFKYFGRTDVVGETFTACCAPQDPMEFKIAGVMKDMPEATHFQIDFLILMEPSMFASMPNILDTWTSVNVYTYFKMKDGVSVADLQARYEHWLNNESPFIDMLRQNGMDMGETQVTDRIRHRMMVLEDLHLHARQDAGNMPDLSPMGDIKMVYTFTTVAGLILLIASINFMNLSTARAVKRAREVALRKVMGASRRQVALQFLGEAVAVATIAFLLALVGVEMALPIYSEAIGKTLSLNLMSDLPMLLSLIGLAVVVGLVSGSYPATFLSRFLPARILKANKSSDAAGSGSLRSALVVFQFAISIGLAVCTAVVYGQTLYAQNMDVGYGHKGKLALGGIRALSGAEQAQTLKNRLESLDGVSAVTFSSDVPSQDRENNTGFRRLDITDQGADNSSTILNYYSVDYGFMESYGIEPLVGRTFSEDFGTDTIIPIPRDEDRIGSASAIINETAARMMGYASPEEAVGQVVQGNIFRAGTHDLTIIGVIPDIYFRSIKHGVRPSIYFSNPDLFRSATIEFETNNIAGLQEQIGQIWREMAPLSPISLQFVSDMLRAQYDAEERQAQLFAAFATLALVVACLGLYGLASFTAEQRTREIGIRKVLGATVVDIVRLLVWQFSRPVLIANLIAWPVAWYLMSGWLEGFQYRLESGFLMTSAIVASVVALLIAWVTVASRAVKVAQANPIHALRYE